MNRLGVTLIGVVIGMAASGSVAASRDAANRFPAPLRERIAAEARGTARSLGDTSVKTAEVYGPDSRYLLVKASSGDLVQKLARERRGFYLIVLHGHFICRGCSVPPGGKPPRGSIATVVWSRSEGVTDSGVSSHLGPAMSRLGKPTIVGL